MKKTDNQRRLNTSRDVRTTGLKEAQPSDDGQKIRVVFSTYQDRDVAFQIPTDAVQILLPILAKAAQLGKQLAGEQNTRQVFPIESGGVSVTEHGQILFDFVLPGGAQFAFQIDRTAATALQSSLSQLLAQTGGRPADPIRH